MKISAILTSTWTNRVESIRFIRCETTIRRAQKPVTRVTEPKRNYFYSPLSRHLPE